MSFINIATRLYAIMTTVKASSSYLAEVFSYDPGYTDNAGFPYACLITRTSTEEVLDTAYNQALYRFTIRAVDVWKDKAQVETTMRSLADDLLAELRKRENILLSGTVDRVLPFEVSFSWESGVDQVPLRVLEINIDCLKSHSIW